MRTIDAYAYIQQKLAAEVARYPAGSVSKREVIFSFESCDEEIYCKLDRSLTKLIYDEAAKASSLKAPAKYSDEKDRLTALARAVIQSLF